MWANGNQSTQWWPMNYGYQYPLQDSSADWATRAALWAQQRQAQENMTKQHQEYYAATHKEPINEPPPLPDTDPPPPPGETALIPQKSDHEVDNLETVAMDDESLDTTAPEQGMAVTRLDYNHGQPLPLPEVGPPPPIPGMQTFDHNHGFTPVAGVQPYGHMPAQRFDYGHQSHQLSSNAPPTSHWYEYDHDDQHHKHYDGRHHSRLNRNSEPAESPVIDYSTLSDVKKKALPLWIREGLEKMEREKQKKQEQELKKSLNSSTSSLSNIAGYNHGNIPSPVPSPEHVQSDEENVQTEKVKKQTEEEIRHSQPKKTSKQRWSPKKSHKSESSDEEGDSKSDTEKQEEMLVKMRTMLTEVLLTVTNDELHSIAKESYNEALTAENKQLRNSGGLNILKNSWALGVGDYGSDSESSDEESPQPEERHHAVSEPLGDLKQSPRSPLRDQYENETSSHSLSNSPRQKTPVDTSDRESERSNSSKKKKHRSKHKRKDRSPSVSRSKHRSRHSRSRSRTPKKHKSRKREKSRSPSDFRKSKRHSSSSSRSPRRHRKRSESYSRSPPSSRKHRRRRRRSSDSESPRRKHSRRSRSSSSERHREGKRGRKRRSRSRSRSSTPRRKRH